MDSADLPNGGSVGDLGLPTGAKVYELGPNNYYTKVTYENEWVGINEWHWRAERDVWCGGWVPFQNTAWTAKFDQAITAWTVTSLEPLDLSPSLLCTVCGSHGFIKQGKWVPA